MLINFIPMQKATAFLVTALGVLALTGAGCSNTEEGVKSTDENTTEVSTSTTASENSSSTPTEYAKIEVSAESLGNGVISVKWSVPENFDRTKSFQVLHSAKPNPEHPTAFWFQYTNDTRQTELNNIALGKRYIRVCEFDLDKKECVNYSNEVELEVK
jgi:hypothetical protein